MSDWRKGKTVVECHRHMLDNEIFCDVTFEVGPDDCATEMIRAHKYMLAARSEVFLAMFNSDLKETGDVVRIVDISPADFRHMLRYIYSDDTKLTADDIMGQMYAAEKYILSGLIESCEQWMEQNIDSDNACTIMQCADLYNRKDLLTNAREYILQNAARALPGPGFVKLSQNIVKELVAHDELLASENVIYEACVRWAQHQCSEKGKEATGSAIRQALGDCLQLIRFPLIEQTQLVQLIKRFPDVLTKDEEISVMRHILDGSDTPFSKTKRTSLKPSHLCRFTSHDGGWSIDNGTPDAISFTCDSSILLNGITIYGSGQGLKNDIEVEVLTDDDCVIYKEPRKQILFVSETDPMLFLFKEGVRIPAGIKYTIIQKMWGDETIYYYGQNGKDCVVCENVTFRFYESTHSENSTDVHDGQIPGLLFTKC